ncbi:MAG: YgiQ family radical SAM protein [Candidatus Omnitrophota bacterium]
MKTDFLPICREDMEKRGWKELDVILISGDAYVDHPSYGTAVIARVLERHGFKIGIISQPDWRSTEDFKKLGKPRLFFGITSGSTDSMIANYTANKKPRGSDDYSAGGKTGLRPDRAVIIYANRAREVFKDVPIVLGGIGASLRRLAHYDYWDNAVRRSILCDSRADILVYGMGERQVVEIARRLNNKEPVESLDGIRGTAVIRKNIDSVEDDCVVIPSFENVLKDKDEFTRAFVVMYNQMNPFTAKAVAQQHQERFVIQFPPALPLSPVELDAVYELPYARKWHPVYDASGGVKGLATVEFSITSHRGCSGECSFCALYFHQGRIVQSRSAASIVKEARMFSKQDNFKGTITDVGGPTANMYAAKCSLWEKEGFCADKKCLTPEKCKNFDTGYRQSIEMLREIRSIPNVKHVFIGSGFRHDLLTGDYARDYLEEICRYHISGLMKVAPEHCSEEVLRVMNKPPFAVYEKFVEDFKKAARRAGKNIFIVNYFLSAHPGCSLKEALDLALYLAQRKIRPEQIQDFIPAPMTPATCMYYTEKDPFTKRKIYVPKTFRERKKQRALIQYANPVNRKFVIEALKELKAERFIKKLTG